MNDKEIQDDHQNIFGLSTNYGAVLLNKPAQADEIPCAPKMFTFDHAYDCNSCQEDIYDECAQPLVQNVMEGYNGTIFAYGQTGTGKTHTMTGHQDQIGIVPRAFMQIFSEIESESSECKYLLRASYLEIYNEEIRDLLSKDPKKKL